MSADNYNEEVLDISNNVISLKKESDKRKKGEPKTKENKPNKTLYTLNNTSLKWEKRTYSEGNSNPIGIEIVLNGVVNVIGTVKLDSEHLSLGYKKSTRHGLLIKVETKEEGGQLQIEYLVLSKADLLDPKNLPGALHSMHLNLDGTEKLFIHQLVKDLCRQANNAKNTIIYSVVGRIAKDGIIVYNEGVLTGGKFFRSNSEGVTSIENGTNVFVPSKIKISGVNPEYFVTPKFPSEEELKAVKHESLQLSISVCNSFFGSAFLIALLNEILNIIIDRREFGIILLVYISGSTQEGKSFLAELISRICWGTPFRPTEKAHTTVAGFKHQITMSGVGIMIDEADKASNKLQLSNGSVITRIRHSPDFSPEICMI